MRAGSVAHESGGIGGDQEDRELLEKSRYVAYVASFVSLKRVAAGGEERSRIEEV